MTISVERTALLIIDVQAGMFSIPEFQLHEPEEFLGNVSDLISRARALGVAVIYVQHDGAPGSPVEVGTDGGEIHDAIAALADDRVIHKDHSDAFLRTDLHAELEALGVTTLVVCGMQSEYCVDTTCRSAHGLGYEVHLVQDAHTTGDAGSLSGKQIIDHHNETLGGAFVTLRSAEEVFG